MKEIKIVAKHDIIGGLGHKIYTKDKVYKAFQPFTDDEMDYDGVDIWFVESDVIINEMPTYTWEFIIQHFEMIDERRDKQIDLILKKSN